MSSKLYVGNLSFQLSEDEMKTLFAEHGAVNSVKIITDRETGRSRGFGFVEMGSGDEAQAAIDALDGQDNNGRALRVSVAQEKKPSDGVFNRR